jgi:hypothetical protein
MARKKLLYPSRGKGFPENRTTGTGEKKIYLFPRKNGIQWPKRKEAQRMGIESDFDSIPIGLDLGEWEMVLDEETVRVHADRVQWEDREILEKHGLAPPGISIDLHAKMQFAKLTWMKSAIWAKSEHEFLMPFRLGRRIKIRGKIVDKFIKRGKRYRVAEFETVDEEGRVLMRSRETGVLVE